MQPNQGKHQILPEMMGAGRLFACLHRHKMRHWPIKKDAIIGDTATSRHKPGNAKKSQN